MQAPPVVCDASQKTNINVVVQHVVVCKHRDAVAADVCNANNAAVAVVP